MSFFSKKKENSDCECCCCNTAEESTEVNFETRICCGKSIDVICRIKVLGAGCKSCEKLFENVKTAVKEMGSNIEIEYVTDMQKVMEYGVMRMPVLVVNEKIVSMGKVLKKQDVIALLGKLV